MDRHDTEAIERLLADAESAVLAGDLDGYLALVDDQAVKLWPGLAPVVGKAAIRKLYSEHVLGDLDWLAMRHIPQELQIAGDWAYTWGRAEGLIRDKATGKESGGSTNYLQIVRKHPDGSWRIWRSIHNDNPTPYPK